MAATEPPFSDHGNGPASTLPHLSDFFWLLNSFGDSRKARGSCCSHYIETGFPGLRRPVSVQVNVLVTQRQYVRRLQPWVKGFCELLGYVQHGDVIARKLDLWGCLCHGWIPSQRASDADFRFTCAFLSNFPYSYSGIYIGQCGLSLLDEVSTSAFIRLPSVK